MKPNKPNIKPYIKQFYYGNAGYLFLALLQTVFMTAANLLVSWLIQQIIDMIGGVDIGFSFVEIIGFTILGIVLILLGCGFAYFSKPRFISKAVFQYKNYVFSELSKKGISAFSGENTSTYISALSNDVTSIEMGYLANIFVIFDQVVMFCGALLLMFYYSPLLTFASIAIAILPMVASILTGELVEKAEKKVSDQNESYVSTLRDALVGFSVIKSFRAEKEMCRLYSQDAKQVADAKEHRRKMLVVVQSCANVAGSILQLGIFLFGAYLAISDSSISAGSVLVFVQLLNFVINPIATIPGALAECKASKALIEKVAQALETNVREEGKEIPAHLDEGIRLEDVSFGYTEGSLALQNVNTSFQAGESYAIVGTSGSGKSTLLNLLMASHGTYSGQITYDSQELREVSSDSLYEITSMIQQNVFVFNDTIQNNITLFRPFPEEEVERAIQRSGLEKLIAQKGRDYLCGENGNKLSGGEKQRISIARSLLRKAPLLLVDEATASLDRETAYHIMDSILELQDLTRIVVTHTLDEGLLRRYDKILVMKKGRIVEEGTFDDLMDRKGDFHALYTTVQ